MLGDGVVYRNGDGDDVLVVTALETDADHFRRVCADMDVEIERAHAGACRTCRSRARARGSCWPR